MRPRHLVAVLSRRWWIPFLSLLVAGAAGLAYARLQPVGYVSYARMWVRGTLRVTEMAQYTEDSGSFFGTQVALMESSEMRLRALNRLKRLDPGFTIPRDKDGNKVPVSLRVNQAPKSAVFVLECSSPDPKYAKDFLNASMDEFLAYKNEVRAATAGDVLASVSSQVYKQQASLKEEQEKLREFQRENNVVLLEEQFRDGANRLAELNNQVASLELQVDLMDAAALERIVTAQSRTNFIAASPNAGSLMGLSASIPTVSDQIVAARQRLEGLKLQKEQLSRYLKPKHPKIVALDEDVARGEKALEFLTQQNQEYMATAKDALRIRIRSLGSAVKDLETEVRDVNRRHADYEGIKANIERQQSLYNQLLTLLRSVDLNSNIDQESVAIFERASEPVLTRKRTAYLLGMALAIGAFFGFGTVYLLARLDDRCDDLDDVRAAFDEEVFGQIPDVAIRSRRRPLLVPLNARQAAFVESCRGLRSTLLFGLPEPGEAKVILVTSAIPGEGKSTVAVNLAQALSAGGLRVLLIDGDLRRGRLHDTLKKPAERGLIDVLRQVCELESCIVPTEQPNLAFLPGGRSAGFTGELFLSAAFDAMLREVRQTFDYIVIDTVPVLAADDATTIAPKTDGVLFVLKRGSTRAALAREALELLYRRKCRVLGLVLNRANSTARSYRYYNYSEYHRSAASSRR